MGKQSEYAREALSADITKILQIFGGEEDFFRAQSDPDDSITHPMGNLRGLVNSLKELHRDVIRTYGNDSFGRTPVLSPAMRRHIKSKYNAALNAIDRFYEWNINDNAFEDREEVKAAADQIIGMDLKKKLTDELNDLLQAEAEAAGENLLEDLQTEEDVDNLIEQVTRDIDAAHHPVLGFGAEHPGGPNHPSIIPEAIQSTGDLREIAEFYVINGKKKNLTPEDADYLAARMRSLAYLQKVKEAQKQASPKTARVVTGKDGSILMPDLCLYNQQTSGNGCWSCAYQLLLQSRGVFLDQKDIRYYRPDMNVEMALKTDAKNLSGMISDRMNSPFEFADLMLDLVPNTAMGNIVLTLDLNAEENLKKKLTEDFDKAVRRAFLVEQSPVAVSSGGHYVTVVGIDKDGKYLVKDPLSHDPNETKIMTPEKIIQRAVDTALEKGSNVFSVQLTYLKSLNPENPLPQEFNRIQYNDNGELDDSAFRPLDVNGPTDFKGQNFTNMSGNPAQGYSYQESLYVPKHVINAAPSAVLTGNEDKLRTQIIGAYPKGPTRFVNDDEPQKKYTAYYADQFGMKMPKESSDFSPQMNSLLKMKKSEAAEGLLSSMRENPDGLTEALAKVIYLYHVERRMADYGEAITTELLQKDYMEQNLEMFKPIVSDLLTRTPNRIFTEFSNLNAGASFSKAIDIFDLPFVEAAQNTKTGAEKEAPKQTKQKENEIKKPVKKTGALKNN